MHSVRGIGIQIGLMRQIIFKYVINLIVCYVITQVVLIIKYLSEIVNIEINNHFFRRKLSCLQTEIVII